MLQRCVALKMVVASRFVQHHLNVGSHVLERAHEFLIFGLFNCVDLAYKATTLAKLVEAH